MVAGLNSNPEILLRKRRNADRIRLEKQELAQRRQELKKKQARARKNKFERAESIVATSLATQREKERIKRVSKLEAKRAKGDDQHLASDRDFILKVLEDGSAATADADAGADADSLHTEKCIYDGKPTLLFVVRIRGPTAAKIPQKAHKVLSLLRLTELNTGVFLRLTAQVYPLLKLVAPYVVVGEPSLASVRSLIQKRSRVLVNSDDQEEPKESILNDNNLVEEKLGSEGIICVEDIIHEIATLGESFAKCNFFLLPFRLNREVSGFSALSKLQKIRQREWQKRTLKVSNAATAPVVQVDIDSLIAKLN